MLNEYEFTGRWSDMKTPPPNATRCLVTDGDLVLIATYLNDDDKSVWMYQGLTAGETFNVIGWMELPRPMEKLVTNEPITINETPVASKEIE